jgi:hypothetical protein
MSVSLRVRERVCARAQGVCTHICVCVRGVCMHVCGFCGFVCLFVRSSARRRVCVQCTTLCGRGRGGGGCGRGCVGMNGSSQ